MAITRRFQARAVVSAEVHSQLATMKTDLLKQKIEILSETPVPGGVEVTFCGQGLGAWAVPAPPTCEVLIAEGKASFPPAKKSEE